jgi:hypothetical protein
MIGPVRPVKTVATVDELPAPLRNAIVEAREEQDG